MDNARTAIDRPVIDHSGVAIGTATPSGDVYDHSRVRIGTVTVAGDAVSASGVRIGRVRSR
ncbi:hypothetical protein [Pseudonocardia abyssalis]|jgi:hypothetical protein|uniref:Uncharacterized protein n=1 Tax=Pseudonocardia abyssalis TaxID=2792008 RepID=A0ABS6UQ11_9PSEU|nr:hypothetical protein [Pseudonocardia abyssalis]MBW0116031.1 hypothetical protein [Pseudonocardia abyssalis]MBW0133889.1 hypothetical protein [Pseudonocardia abyssalis]